MSAWAKTTLDDCLRVVESFEFRGGLLLWCPKLTAARTTDAVSLRVSLQFVLPSRDGSGRPLNIGSDRIFTLTEINGSLLTFEEHLARFIHALVEHEMHESIWAGGRQLLDPHLIPRTREAL